MVNIDRIVECLTGSVGFRNSDRSGIQSFSGAQTGSTSGQYYTDEPGITASYMQMAKPKDYATLADYAEDVNRTAISETMAEYIAQHKELTGSREIMSAVNPVRGMVRMQDQVAKSGRFCYIRFNLRHSDTLVCNILRVGVQFNALNPNLTLYLYETSQNEPIATYTLTGHTKVLSLQWFDINLKCPYKSTTGGTFQSYLLGYYENDLNGNAVNTQIEDACCGNERWVNNYRQHVFITGGSVMPAGQNGTNLPDPNFYGQTSQTFGLHVSVSVTCDVTDYICDHVNTFAPIIRKRGAMRIFRDYYNNSNVNREADMSRDRAMTNYAATEVEYKRLLKTMSVDIMDIDGICMPCNERKMKTAQTW